MGRLCLSLLCPHLLLTTETQALPSAPLAGWGGNRKQNSDCGENLSYFQKNCSTRLTVLTWSLEEKYSRCCWDKNQEEISTFSRLHRQCACARWELTEHVQPHTGSHLQTSRHFSRLSGVWAGARLTWLEAARNCSNWQGEGNISATPITPALLGIATQLPHRKLFHQKIF